MLDHFFFQFGNFIVYLISIMDINVDMHSVIQNACQTPTAPKNLERINAIGIMTMIQRNNEMNNDPFPFPNPSNTPQTITEIEEITNPQLMIRNA